MLKTANFTQASDNFKIYCDDIVNNNSTLIVTRNDDKHVVVQSLDNFNQIHNELANLKKELFIHKRIIEAEHELAGKEEVVAADDIFAEMQALDLSTAHAGV